MLKSIGLVLVSALGLGFWIWGMRRVFISSTPHRVAFFLLSFFLGIPGTILALCIITDSEVIKPPEHGDRGVVGCPYCNYPYLPSDYNPDAAIICTACKMEIPQFSATQSNA